MVSAGKKTLIIEKHNLPGGCASSFCRGRFEFEPSLHELCGIGPENNPGEIRLLMDRFGIKVDWQCVDDCFRCISTCSDGTPMDVTLPTGVKAFIDKTVEYVPGSRTRMEKFFKLLEKIRDLIDYLDKPPKEMSPAYMIKNFSNVFKTAGYSAEELGIKDYSIFIAGSADSEKEYETLKKIDTNHYSIFLCYNVANPHASPDGTAMCSFTTMFTAPDDWNNISDEDYAAVKNKFAKRIINEFEEKTGISLTPYIEEVSIASPWTFSRYLGVPEGSVYGYIHPCSSFALSDLVLEVPTIYIK